MNFIQTSFKLFPNFLWEVYQLYLLLKEFYTTFVWAFYKILIRFFKNMSFLKKLWDFYKLLMNILQTSDEHFTNF
jgi:hypothetical protein